MSGELVLLYKSEQNGCPPPKKGVSRGGKRWTLGAPDGGNAGCTLTLKQLRARSIEGPWVADAAARGPFFPGAISRMCVEGASALELPLGRWLLLFDQYRSDCTLLAPPPCGTIGGEPARTLGLAADSPERVGDMCTYATERAGFGGMTSLSLGAWREASAHVRAPKDYKHGTALRLPRSALEAVCKKASPFLATPLCSRAREIITYKSAYKRSLTGEA